MTGLMHNHTHAQLLGTSQFLTAPPPALLCDLQTIAEREALEAEEEQLAAQEKRRLVERKAETRQLLVEVIAADAAAEAAQTQGPKVSRLELTGCLVAAMGDARA